MDENVSCNNSTSDLYKKDLSSIVNIFDAESSLQEDSQLRALDADM